MCGLGGYHYHIWICHVSRVLDLIVKIFDWKNKTIILWLPYNVVTFFIFFYLIGKNRLKRYLFRTVPVRRAITLFQQYYFVFNYLFLFFENSIIIHDSWRCVYNFKIVELVELVNCEFVIVIGFFFSFSPLKLYLC